MLIRFGVFPDRVRRLARWRQRQAAIKRLATDGEQSLECSIPEIFTSFCAYAAKVCRPVPPKTVTEAT
jgi:hypothetical protein